MGSESFVTDSSVVSLDICVLLRLSRLDVAERYVVLAGPLDELATDIFRAVVYAYHCRFPSPRDDLV